METFRGPSQRPPSAEFATAGAVHEPLLNYRQQSSGPAHVPAPRGALPHQQLLAPFLLRDPRRPRGFALPVSNEASPWQPPPIQSGVYPPGFMVPRPLFSPNPPPRGVPPWAQGGTLFSPTSIQNERNFVPPPLSLMGFGFHPHQPMGFQPQAMSGPQSSLGLQGALLIIIIVR